MNDIAGLAIGLVLGLWSTHQLEHDVATLAGQHPLDRVWLLRHWVLRVVPTVAAVCVMTAWSSSAPLVGLGGFWLGRTGYLVAALLKSRRFA